MIKTMRDAFLEKLYEKMQEDEKIVFLAADFGAPLLDRIREDFPSRFYNVGIAEQNLINVAVGLALEGFKVYAYAIAPFITMRCYEQIRVNVAILSQVRDLNINIIGVGAGVSYEVSGPTHHSLEDLSIMRTLPNVEVFSCSDFALATEYVKRTLEVNRPKYLRFDAKPQPLLEGKRFDLEDGFRVIAEGEKIAFIATGFMSQKVKDLALKTKTMLVDLYLLDTYNRNKLVKTLDSVKTIVTLEEGFIGAGGLDAEINALCKEKKVINLGFEKNYKFEVGPREYIHTLNGVGLDSIEKILDEEIKNG